ncbi:MAG: 30S ribosomal protein S19e [Thermoplasmata archaeon]|nr:30S ribosomal protein S19e [Thermoplasmata archaeon]
MTTVYDVPPNMLIERLTQKFKSEGSVQPPEWVLFVKTGTHKEKSPVEQDWWFKRLAAVLRKVYVYGPIGSSRLAAEFGGKKDMGSAPYRAVKGSGNIVRTCLKQLQSIGLIEGKNHKGRVVTSKGRSLLDKLSNEIITELSKEDASLGKYTGRKGHGRE